jgi:hypothetical protein
MPRNDASSTVFVKNVRKSTCAGNHRMHAISRKSTSRLMRNRSTPAADPRAVLLGSGERTGDDVSIIDD